MATGPEELDRIKAHADWGALIELALADPPAPAALIDAYSRWQRAFEAVHGKWPRPADHSAEMDRFCRALALAHIPAAVLEWSDIFAAEHARCPRLDEFPDDLRAMIPKSKRGRGRCDTKKMRDAAKAWEAEQFRWQHEEFAAHVAFGKSFVKDGGTQADVFDLNRADLLQQTPSELALEVLAEKTGRKLERLRDMLFPRGKRARRKQ